MSLGIQAGLTSSSMELHCTHSATGSVTVTTLTVESGAFRALQLSASTLPSSVSPFPTRWEWTQAPSRPDLKIDELACKETIELDIGVTNHGPGAGSNVVIVYSKPPAEVEVADAPLKQVVGYRREFVPAGGTAKVHFSLNACKAFGVVEKTAYTVLPSGTSTVVVGDGDIAVSLPVEVQFQL